jgi:hypothetical protein
MIPAQTPRFSCLKASPHNPSERLPGGHIPPVARSERQRTHTSPGIEGAGGRTAQRVLRHIHFCQQCRVLRRIAGSVAAYVALTSTSIFAACLISTTIPLILFGLTFALKLSIGCCKKLIFASFLWERVPF